MPTIIRVVSLVLYSLPLLAVAGPAKVTIPHSWIDSCPKPFKGSGDPIAMDLNATWVSKVGAEGSAPNEKTKKEILAAAVKALDAGQLATDLGKPGEESLRGASTSKKASRDGRSLGIESKGCGLALRQWRDLAVIWMREPCSPAVLLFHQDKGNWKFACITEFIHSEAGF